MSNSNRKTIMTAWENVYKVKFLEKNLTVQFNFGSNKYNIKNIDIIDLNTSEVITNLFCGNIDKQTIDGFFLHALEQLSSCGLALSKTEASYNNKNRENQQRTYAKKPSRETKGLLIQQIKAIMLNNGFALKIQNKLDLLRLLKVIILHCGINTKQLETMPEDTSAVIQNGYYINRTTLCTVVNYFLNIKEAKTKNYVKKYNLKSVNNIYNDFELSLNHALMNDNIKELCQK